VRLVSDDVTQDGGPILVDGGSGGANVAVSCRESAGCGDFTLLVERAGQSGSFTTVITAQFEGKGYCTGESTPVVEARIDVEG
jgi:hypothetical protein